VGEAHEEEVAGADVYGYGGVGGGAHETPEVAVAGGLRGQRKGGQGHIWIEGGPDHKKGKGGTANEGHEAAGDAALTGGFGIASEEGFGKGLVEFALFQHEEQFAFLGIAAGRGTGIEAAGEHLEEGAESGAAEGGHEGGNERDHGV